MPIDSDMTAEEATEMIRSHPSFLPNLREYVQMVRDRSMFAGLDLSSEDIEAMRAESLRRWEPEIALLESRNDALL